MAEKILLAAGSNEKYLSNASFIAVRRKITGTFGENRLFQYRYSTFYDNLIIK
jgi:hypothetical protein